MRVKRIKKKRCTLTRKTEFYTFVLFFRLLYMQVVRLRGCVFPKKYKYISEYISKYCSYIYKEAKTSEKLNFPHYDIFLEQGKF